METVAAHLCEKCGESFSEISMYGSHSCSKNLTNMKCNKGQLENYNCPLCNECFSKPGALKQHFRIHGGDLELKGPFSCTEQGCQFSSPDRQEYQAHLTSTHGITLVHCTYRSCKLAFYTQREKEGHWRNHFPFHCPRCHFVTLKAKQLSDHYLEHDISTDPHVKEMVPTTLCLEGSSQSLTSGRPRRKQRPNPAYGLLSTEEKGEVETEEHEQKVKRAKMEMGKDTSTVTDGAVPLSTKDYLVEGTEHIYRTNTCPKCRRCFKMRSHLQEHLHLHFPDPNLQCPTCKHYFTSKSKLRIHMLREVGQKVHHCHLCDYSAVERNAIRRHLISTHADEAGNDINSHVYPCPTCGQSFCQSRSLKAHMKTHNILLEEKPVACFHEGCSFQSSLRKVLLKHTTKMHGVKAVECRHHACNAIFRSEKDMEDHHRLHLAYHCPQCEFSCSNKTIYLQHQRQGHPGNEEISCGFCSFVTFNPVELEQHIGHLHANEKIHHCPQCNYVTSHKRGLKRHMLLHSGEKPHKCSLCDFRCRDESYLSKHMLTHSDDKNFMCSECGYITKWKHYLNVHMRKHAGDLRYQCDQCPYRCHRMDQLNSHKLRHQAKSLMCEVCAYACKRKYELRNHMLTKHSGEEKQPAVYDCKYCTYTTCYRQALQNHENCKHTKLKEFRCALCLYSSFSTISLFLHKRKVHGYVPGDKEWLENYSAKEKERNAIEFMQDFYKKPSTADGQSEQSATRAPPSQSTKNQSEQKELTCLVGQNANQETVAVSQSLDTANINDCVPQVVTNNNISVCAPSVKYPEEYCTLVLTTLSTTEYETTVIQREAESCQSLETLGLGQNTSQEKPDSAISTVEEDSVAFEDCDSGQSDLDNGDGQENNTSQPAEPAENQTQKYQVEDTGDIINNSSFTSGQNEQHLESEKRLKTMKKHDRDQAEAMVLEGRVQMLVVQSKDIYRCDKCSYVSRKETALKFHCQSLCQGRLKGHKCQACGAKFRQRRGLDTHILKKCPARQQKTRTPVGMSTLGRATEEGSPQGQHGSKQPEERPSVDRTELPSLDDRNSRDTEYLQSHQHKEISITSPLKTCKGDDEKTGSSSESKNEKSKIVLINKHLRVKLVKKRTCNKDRTGAWSSKNLYTKKDGKFKCRFCNFSSVKLSTVERHCSACRKASARNKNQILSKMNDYSDEALAGRENQVNMDTEIPTQVPMKSQILSCSRCPFKCSQKRALDRHEKQGCLKPNEVQCQQCSFVAKSQTSLTNHVSYVHDKTKSGVAKSKCLHCEHCTFTCKQERCMVQHVALKHKGARPHHCHYCPFSTTRRYRLEEHESLHTGVGRHSCSECNKTFGTLTKLRQHKARVHERQPSHFCSLCDFSSYTLDDIRRHNFRCHSGELQHTCAHCEARFSSDAALRNHCKRMHQLQDCFSCQQCDYSCGTKTALKTHQQKHPPLKCGTCQESFDTKESLKIHQRIHLSHQCHLCPFATKTRQGLAQHLLDEHEDGPSEDKPLKCSNCEFSCQHHLVLEQHLRSHGGKRLYKCTDCKYSTRNKQKITWHVRIHTGEKPYSCEQCSYTCTDPSRLKFHMRVHQEEKKYLCPDCGYKCKWATQLKYHMTKHTGEKPYTCKDCDYRTNRADALRAHRDTQHCDVRSYICEKCGKAFKTRFILKTHQRQHSDDRAYTCGLCHKAFRWPAGLRHHYLSHTKQQPFCCCHCPYRAKQKFQVVKHLQRHHPEVSVEQGVVRSSEAVSLTLKEALQGTLDGRVVEVSEENGQDEVAEAVEPKEVQEESVQKSTA
ncbi:zinc finger protein 142 [Lampris incognitus]|uniref:zinc finger protein 142 n=1 Tax=Lampris incognitus TaxID=2546036 RepID=UPI0024B59C7C|nr:zinc finger protein 142 [Lampris incognitus]